MVLAAATVEVIERRFARAAIWMAIAALLSAAGLAHAYRYTPGDTAILLAPAWPWALGYLAVAALFLVAPLVTEPGETQL
jgi:AGZA family xanthine/uracil permease-like MFS transporter